MNKNRLILTIYAVMLFGLMIEEVKAVTTPTPKAGMMWQMTFDDEFDGTAIDTNKWRGGYSHLQWCVNGTAAAQWTGLTVSDGSLKLQPILALTPDATRAYENRAIMHTGGLNASDAKFSQKYGYFECRAQFPKLSGGRGFWFSFWVLPLEKTDNTHTVPGVQQEEIDILETIMVPGQTNHTVIHLHDLILGQWGMRYPALGTPSIDVTNSFHTYGLYWKNDGTKNGTIQIYFDGIAQTQDGQAHDGTHTLGGTYTLQSPAPGQPDYWDKGIYIILQIIASSAAWNSTNSTNNPFIVDYVRAYKEVPDGASPSIAVTSPNGGENWPANSNQTVRWTSAGTVGNVKIDLSTDGGSTWTTLMPTTPNSGSQSVIIPNTASTITTCRIRVAETDGSPFGISNSNFSITVSPVTQQEAYPTGVAWQIGTETTTIQSENYDKVTTGIGEGEAYHDTTNDNKGGGVYRTTEYVDVQACTDTDGGYNVGWTMPGEWLEYSINVTQGGEYKIILRGANGLATNGGPMHLEFGTHKETPYIQTAPVSIPPTGGYQVWADVILSTGVTLTAGNQVMKLVMNASAATGCGNLNYIKIIKIGSDTTPPIISGVIPASITGSEAAITWTTNEIATSKVEYGLTTSYGNATPVTDIGGVTSHSVTLISLTENTTYHYRMVSVDMNGNTTTTADYAFTTTANDPNPPVISNVAASVTQNTAIITWTTDENSDSQVAYGLTTTLGSTTTLNTAPTRLHSVPITGLEKGKTYYYKVYSKDAVGNLAASVQYSFKTSNIKYKIYTYYYDDGTINASLKFKLQVYNIDENGIATDYTGTITFTSKNVKNNVLDTTVSTLISTDAGEKEVSVPFRSDIYTIELTGDTTAPIVISFNDMYIAKLVGYQGGSIRGANGLKISVPTGVLSNNKYLASIKTNAVPAVQNSMKYVNTVNPICYDFGELTFTNSAPLLQNQTFTRAVNITIPYTTADIGKLNEDGLRIYYWTGTDWDLVTGVQTVDKVNNTVTATVTHFSTYRILGSYISADLNNIKVYPNPFNPTTAVQGMLKVTNLPTNSTMNLYTVAGRLVRELKEVDFGNLGWLEWDGKNNKGDEVSKGIYIYQIEDAAGKKKAGKIGLVK
ncbi:MAG: carbohydrate-binding protein [Elusimicrobia bacterium]|nr:carbohydrate-binding protein [Elusimicrobiota bacterium]